MSNTFPGLSVGMPDVPSSKGPVRRVQGQRAIRAIPSGAGAVAAASAMSPQSYGDRLLADAHLSKCAFLRVVHRFIDEYAACIRRNGADLFIKACNYRAPQVPRSTFEPMAHANLRPSMEWCPLYLTHQTDLADARVHVVLRPYAPEAVVTLPQVVRPPSGVVAPDASVLQVGQMEFPLCEPLTIGITVVCSGAAVDRSMVKSDMHELTHKASVAHRSGKSAGLFYHALAQEPLHEWRSVDDVCSPTEYLSKTSEGVHVVLYQAGRGEREHSYTRQLMPTVAIALRDIHLSMDDLFSISDPPRWPMVLAFMQLCKPSPTPSMQERAKAVLEAYRAARSVQHEMEDALLCSEYVSDDTYGTPAYHQLQEHHVRDTPDYPPTEREDMGRRSRPPMRTQREYNPHAAKPQCAIC